MPKVRAAASGGATPVASEPNGRRGDGATPAVSTSGGKGGSSFDSRLIPEFGGDQVGQDVVEWFTRAEVLSKHHGVDLALVLPARLTGGAFAVWLQIPEEDRHSTDTVRDALYNAFAMDPLAAYDAYSTRRLQPGESADVYLSDLRRLAALYGGVPDRALACAFISGLPDAVRGTIRAGTRAEALNLSSILARVRAVLSDERASVVAAAAAATRQADGINRRRTDRPASRPPLRCWVCGQAGHFARRCPNAMETASAPASSPNQ